LLRIDTGLHRLCHDSRQPLADAVAGGQRDRQAGPLGPAALARRLPWDAQQTHLSLAPYLIGSRHRERGSARPDPPGGSYVPVVQQRILDTRTTPSSGSLVIGCLRRYCFAVFVEG
jgi:hypothetical protein